jgi:DNA-binding transcriptional LysR family regulator
MMAAATRAFAPGSAALRYFQAVAQTGSFRRAAAAVHIAPSALSRQVRLLEEELGADLLERARDGVRPTPAGEALLHRLARAAQELDAARAEIDGLRAAERGHVVIGVTETVARDFLAGFLASFCAAHPGVTLRVVVGYSHDLLARLAAGEIEVVVAFGIPADAPVERVVSFDLVTCVMVHRQHRFARRRVVRARDLGGETMIQYDSGTQLARALSPVLARMPERPAPFVTTSSAALTAGLVTLGLGVAVRNRVAPGADALWPDIVYVPFADPGLPPASLACCTRSGRPLSRAAQACATALGRALEEWCAPLKRRGAGG